MTDEQFNPPQDIEGLQDAAADQDQALGGVRKSRLPISGGNLMLAGMFVVAAVAVYLLKQQNGPETASAQQRQAELQVDAAISLLDGTAPMPGQDTRTAEVMEAFACQAKQRQVPPWRLKGNPFVYKPPAPPPPPDVPAPEPQAETKVSKELKTLQEKRAEALAELKKLRLESILSGPMGRVAMISNSVVSVGQIVRGWKIVSIHPRQVVLTCLKMTESLKIVTK